MNKLVQQQRRFRVIYQFPTLGPRTYVHRVKVSFFGIEAHFSTDETPVDNKPKAIAAAQSNSVQNPETFWTSMTLVRICSLPRSISLQRHGTTDPVYPNIGPKTHLLDSPSLSRPHLGVLWNRILVLSFFFCINIFFSFKKCIYVHSGFKIYLARAHSFCLSWNELLAPFWA